MLVNLARLVSINSRQRNVLSAHQIKATCLLEQCLVGSVMVCIATLSTCHQDYGDNSTTHGNNNDVSITLISLPFLMFVLFFLVRVIFFL